MGDATKLDVSHLVFYICDPSKNKKCSKKSKSCGTLCFATTNKRFAKDPNKPLKYFECAKEVNIIKKLEEKNGKNQPS